MTVEQAAICSSCIGEAYLSAEVHDTGTKQVCSYCDKKGNCWTLKRTADRIEEVILAHYQRTPAEMDDYEIAMHNDSENDYEWERDGTSINELIADLVSTSEYIADDVQKILEKKHESDPRDSSGEEDEFASDSYYEEIPADAGPWHRIWEEFAGEIRERNRFFSSQAEQRLDKIFSGLNHMKTWQGEAVCVDAGPGTAIERLYRTRVFRSDDGLAAAIVRPDRHIGPPPHALAGSGRMNARGISVFYGSDEPEAAIAEVRPPVGSYVVLAPFLIIRRLKLLDLRVLEKVFLKTSMFDPKAEERFGRASFLRSLRKKMTMPAMNDDDVAEYLPTQAVADYLSGSMQYELDGIVFPSVQVSGGAANVVLFNKASRVEAVTYPANARVTAETWEDSDDGAFRSFKVLVETVSKARKSSWAKFNIGEYEYKPAPEPADSREMTLRVDTTGLKVHSINGLKFDTESNLVRRSEIDLSGDGDF